MDREENQVVRVTLTRPIRTGFLLGVGVIVLWFVASLISAIIILALMSGSGF